MPGIGPDNIQSVHAPVTDSASSTHTASSVPSWSGVLSTLLDGDDLSVSATRWAMDRIMAGEASEAQIAGFLVALRAKGETVAELGALADSMLASARPMPYPGEALDIVGTGGDRLNTVNISTMAALVCAGAGAVVVKHGNRASSSSSGSADVLEQLGVRLELPVEVVVRSAQEVGITFCFAQVFHPAFRRTAVARREMAIPTAFNFMGPLTNPARVRATAIGVANARMAPLVAGVLAGRGGRGMVFRGEDGLDELTTTGPSRVWEFRNGRIDEISFDPATVGIPRAAISDLRGWDAAFNAQVARDVLAGALGPVRDAVLLNAAAGLMAYDTSAAGSFQERLSKAMRRAERSVDEGAAAAVLQRWVEFTGAAV